MKERRLARGLTQEQVAKLAGVDRTTITKIENGTAKPSVKTAQKIAQVLDFDWTLFFYIA
jgi:transcriptional regulator with XRE-family HTH domain